VNSGILIVAYGQDYDRCAAGACAYTRLYTDLPIHVITNLRSRCDKWKEVPGVAFM